MHITKEQIEEYIKTKEESLHKLADDIFDLAEISMEEHESCKLIESCLKNEGFAVEHGAGGLDTAFRAVYETGTDGVSIGLIAEYDALSMGHGCAHHLQGPAIIGAACCIKELCKDIPVKIVVYGTPAEEAIGGKVIMLENGCFRDIDIAVMTHGSNMTSAAFRCMALENFRVTFRGKEAHAAGCPEKGRSSFDAALLSFQGIEFLREHVREDTRMHYTILDAGGPANVVPGKTVAEYTLRSFQTEYLKEIVGRFMKILDGATLMTETTYIYERDPAYTSNITCPTLDELLMKYAEIFSAKQIGNKEAGSGSTDFGNISYALPGACLNIAFCKPTGIAHSEDYLEAGKEKSAHEAISCSAKTIAAACLEIIEDKSLLLQIQEEFRKGKATS